MGDILGARERSAGGTLVSKRDKVAEHEAKIAQLFELAQKAMHERGSPPESLPEGSTSAERLVHAIDHSDADAVRLLLAEGADANRLTRANKSPLLAACKRGDVGIVEQLIVAGATLTTQALENASLMGHRGVFEILVAHPIATQGTKAADRDALAIARERALKNGWSDFDALMRPHRLALGLTRARR